jgi:hypothetical protein
LLSVEVPVFERFTFIDTPETGVFDLPSVTFPVREYCACP